MRKTSFKSIKEDGFSLIDVVVTVAIIVALSVGGFIAYTGIVDNAKNAALSAAADQGYTAALVAINNGDVNNGSALQDLKEAVEFPYNETAADSGIRLNIYVGEDENVLDMERFYVSAESENRKVSKGATVID